MGTVARNTPAGPTELRVLRQDEWNTWYDNLVNAFGGISESPEERELWERLTEFDRSLGVWDGDTCVGTAGAFSFRLTVPGGARARGRRHDGQCRRHASAAGHPEVDDAPAAGRRTVLGRTAGRPDGLRAGDLRPLRVRHRDDDHDRRDRHRPRPALGAAGHGRRTPALRRARRRPGPVRGGVRAAGGRAAGDAGAAARVGGAAAAGPGERARGGLAAAVRGRGAGR